MSFKFPLDYKKIGKINLATLQTQYNEKNPQDNGKYAPFEIINLQNYNPIYNEFFELTQNNYNSIALNHRYHFLDLYQVYDSIENINISKESFIKFSPLLDPIRYLIGKYFKENPNIKELPSINQPVFKKLETIHNASYVDNFFCYLSSQLMNKYNFINGIDYYGSFLGIQEKFKMNISDDYEYLNQSDFFLKNHHKMYEMDSFEDPFSNFGSRCNKNKLDIHNETEVSHLSVENLEYDSFPTEKNENVSEKQELMYEKNNENTFSDDDSNNSEINYTSDDDSEKGESDEESSSETVEETESDEGSEPEESNDEFDNSDEESQSEESSKENSIYAYIKDFPVQMICLEKCKGTIDDLFSKGEMDEENSASALFQIIMTLIAYQKLFHFTHNDLHTNNIVYVETNIEYLYYKYNEKIYKVPTYGKIFKIIDFGRAIYKLNGKIFCSDSFDVCGDAHTQYNCEPFFDGNKPRLEPNYSFDLCRLGCSIYDFILDEIIDEDEEIDELQRTIIRWCSDDNNKNVLYKKNGDDRYPNFKLYKMIARSVNKHIPKNQLEDPYFSQFLYENKDSKIIDSLVDIDSYPCFA
jgi:hypothetical protein